MSEHFHIYYQSPVGIIKIAGTDHYISEMTFIDTAQIPPNTHRDELPPLAIACVEQLIQYFNGQRRSFEFPFDQTGTAFQSKVWQELLKIPFGKTISYLELAKRLGDTKVIRAAASANGRNNVAIVVPCHRVIGSKSDLVGYAGGLWRKRWLLEHENKIANGVQTLF
ncbi:MAG: methylated-DNA--[protein]-cysteine S-methyltransferase [Chitinophagaceae bacterium]|nr:methylated-DNA--[protein]-cysteine S-methyltransferase [Chitinophagaceae bacterium]